MLRELEDRLKKISATNDKSFFDSLSKSWNDVVQLPPATITAEPDAMPANGGNQNQSHNAADGCKSDDHNIAAEDANANENEESGDRAAQCTPNKPEVRPAVSNGPNEESGVPETPDADIHLVVPTQASSPRKRKRNCEQQSPDQGTGREVQVARNLLHTGRTDYPAQALMSLQAYGDLPQTSQQLLTTPPQQQEQRQIRPPPLPPSRSESADGTQQQKTPTPPTHQQQRVTDNNLDSDMIAAAVEPVVHEEEEESNSDKIVPVMPRTSQQEQSQSADLKNVDNTRNTGHCLKGRNNETPDAL